MQRINLQHIRKTQGITQMQLAEMTGYPLGFISQIENGKAGAPEAFVQKLQEIFKMSLAEIYSQQPMGETSEEVSDASSAEVCEIVRRFINMVERRDEKIAQLEAEIERLNNRLQSLLPQKADFKNTEIYHTEQK
ncbi:MAG: helix-turn-helix domain-containing protein [Bacteroidaceae bacterium]|nr:helix-turn-helix domain-containing protein [Bacteroidaceae bacterium]